MSKRLRRHLSPPMVISMIALFVALGGGYAMAFVGSGQLQKAKADNLPDGSFQVVRTLDSIGSIQARCNSGDNTMTVRFRNTSGVQMASHNFNEEAGDYDGIQVDNNNNDDETVVGGLSGATVRWHVHPTATNDKRPQADIVTSTRGPILNDCVSSEISVLVLNTEEIP